MRHLQAFTGVGTGDAATSVPGSRSGSRDALADTSLLHAFYNGLLAGPSSIVAALYVNSSGADLDLQGGSLLNAYVDLAMAIGVLEVEHGGTGLEDPGTPHQILATGAGSLLEYKTLQGTVNQITVTPGTGTLTLSTPQSIDSGASPTFVRLTLTQATGTAPMTISSTTVVVNLNADLLDGQHASAFAPASHALLGTNHSDSAAGTPVRGDVIYVPASGLWTRLAAKTADAVLLGDGTDVTVSAKPVTAIKNRFPVCLAFPSFDNRDSSTKSYAQNRPFGVWIKSGTTFRFHTVWIVPNDFKAGTSILVYLIHTTLTAGTNGQDIVVRINTSLTAAGEALTTNGRQTDTTIDIPAAATTELDAYDLLDTVPNAAANDRMTIMVQGRVGDGGWTMTGNIGFGGVGIVHTPDAT